jgi:hypothetical protein
LEAWEAIVAAGTISPLAVDPLEEAAVALAALEEVVLVAVEPVGAGSTILRFIRFLIYECFAMRF